MPITAISPWFGGKRTLASRIVKEIGPHRAYFEPFCGSMAVLLAKPECQQETVCDLHRDLTNLAFVLADEDQAADLYGRLSRLMFCEAMLARSRTYLLDRHERDSGSEITIGDAEWATHFMVHSWCARNGTAGTKRMSFQIAVRFTPNGGSAGIRFRNAIESIPAWHHRLRNVVVLNRDAFDVLPRIADQSEVAIYCDPPYMLSTRNGDGDGGYRHDFDEAPAGGLMCAVDDHARLAEALNRFERARIVISYYEHPRLLDLYPQGRWTHVRCARQKNLRRQMKAAYAAEEAPEVLIVNGDRFT